MPIYFIIIICFITSILVTAIGKIQKNKKMLITGKCLILLLSIGLILFAIYKVEKNQEKQGELGQVGQNLTLQQPDRIIYKKTNGDYYIIQEGTKAYSKIYSELYNRTFNPIEGKVYKENDEGGCQIKTGSHFFHFYISNPWSVSDPAFRRIRGHFYIFPQKSIPENGWRQNRAASG